MGLADSVNCITGLRLILIVSVLGTLVGGSTVLAVLEKTRVGSNGALNLTFCGVWLDRVEKVVHRGAAPTAVDLALVVVRTAAGHGGTNQREKEERNNLHGARFVILGIDRRK